MSIDYENLLEFEDSLQLSNPKDTSITLNNLEVKIEYNLIVPTQSGETVDSDIDTIYQEYDYQSDEFTSCDKCSSTISAQNDCCLQYIEHSTHISDLEKSYWMSFLSNPTRTINTLPNYTQMLFLEQGIPYQLRSNVWRKLFLINYNNQIPDTSRLVYTNFQHSYNTETSDQINKDLNRTFPTISFFKDNDKIKELEVVLNVYANYDVELGYCQGLLFLVGTLYYQFKDPQLTFHSLITIMESETDLHDIFTQDLMSSTLNAWYSQFCTILREIDLELYEHLTSFADMKVFLYQWWLSFMSSHTPEFAVINRIMDFCLIQGWKIGMFKISVGLLLINKPILMTLVEGDEEVIYQHLLYECKWGLVLKDVNSFFGELLLSFEPKLFVKRETFDSNKPMKTHKRTHSSMIDKFRNLNISNYSIPHSNQSIFSRKTDTTHGNDLDSIYSEVTVESSNSGNSGNSKFVDYLKLPFSNNDLVKQNKAMKELLVKCMASINNEELKQEISSVVN